nr:uncharacterized protein LOC113704137 isoform X2 [Coffea arabica]
MRSLQIFKKYCKEFPRAVGHQIGFLILRVRHGRCTVHAVKLHRLVIVSSNTIKSKLQVLKHIAMVSQDCQAYCDFALRDQH